MSSAHGLTNIDYFLVAFAQHASTVARRIMDRHLAFDLALQCRGQCFIGSEHVGEVGITPTIVRHFQRVESGSLGRFVDVGHIGMPDGLAGAKITYRSAVDDDVGNDVDLRKRFVERLAIGVWAGWIELAKLSTEGQELRIGETLPPRDDYQARLPCCFNRTQIGTAKGFGQAYPAELGAERCA